MISYFNDVRHVARTLVRARAFMGVVIAILLFMQMVLGTPLGIDEDGSSNS